MKSYYFVTGSTGTVGSELILNLLESEENQIWALMRGDSDEHVHQRLESLISFWELDDLKAADAKRRIIPVKGDMDEQNFGVEEAIYHEIAAQCTHIVHCAGVVRMNLPLDVARRHAVDSARNVVNLALIGKQADHLKKVEVVSTVGVGGRMSTSIPETWITQSRAFHNSYEASKAEAEDYLRRQIEQHDLPMTIHRPSMVVGHSKTGRILQFQIFYHLCEFLSGRRSKGLSPLYGHAILDTVPVDYIAKVLKWSSENEQTTGKVFNLSSGPEQSIRLTALRKIIRKRMKSFGIQLPPIIPLPEFIFKLALKGISPFLNEKLQRALKPVPVFLDYLSDEQLFGSTLSRQFIEENNGPKFLSVDKYLDKVLDYYLSQITQK